MKQRVFESRRKTLWRQDNLSSAECFFVWALAQMKVPWVVFPHAWKASTFWAILVSLWWSSLKMLRQASAVEKPIYMARVSSLTTGPPLQQKKRWMDSTTVCDTSKTRRSRHAWPLPWHAQADWVRVLKNRNWNWNSCAGRSRSLKVCPSA